MTHPIVLDLETQYSFKDVNNDHRKLKVSLVGIYDYGTKCYETYLENELSSLFKKLEHASYLIGFNIRKFDLPVLSPYYVGRTDQFATIDILSEVEKSLGFRISLDSLAFATLGKKKSGHGFLAINYFQKGEMEKLKKYCLDDVRITRELFEYGKKEGHLYYFDAKGKKEIPVQLTSQKKVQSAVSLSLPF
ncbi:hypothetical protein A2Y99_00435 [Candidatus Gottesmanbacteria bacterium RBG_13_37_7]|uniref:YprB ribonuclease H-like domain-containing protein n=1 Tax=Candidatus Gottesmanbacteria bacterium RBG_13_37_7 TaxID=1798369 RepID=A0A1F5YK32_9BACT|nr:MAG: hypothetical protein A2Y99_00435 [Candidatus Gottesmanbacteria bacterium RBG_13_37_7]